MINIIIIIIIILIITIFILQKLAKPTKEIEGKREDESMKKFKERIRAETKLVSPLQYYCFINFFEKLIPVCNFLLSIFFNLVFLFYSSISIFVLYYFLYTLLHTHITFHSVVLLYFLL